MVLAVFPTGKHQSRETEQDLIYQRDEVGHDQVGDEQASGDLEESREPHSRNELEESGREGSLRNRHTRIVVECR